jgi:NAD(P)-dependent dehydrogenase (short-subunit alcohol dehydrogenase family)
MAGTGQLQGKVAVITGAASGIGLATLERFVEEGARVVAADLREDAGGPLEARFPGVVHFVRCDVVRLDELKAAIDAAAHRFGGLDVLFSNAGAAGSRAGVADFDAEGWDFTQALLLRSVAAGAAYAAPHMKRRGGGAIVNTSSISALQAGWAPIAYSVAKAGVLHYTRMAAAELAPHRIRINAIVPGYIATRIFGSALGLDPEQAGRMAETVATDSGRVNPIGRSGLPLDIAQAAVYLASDASGFVTGTHLVVDGGLTVGPRHAWDDQLPGPLAETLGLSRKLLMAQRDRPSES